VLAGQKYALTSYFAVEARRIELPNLLHPCTRLVVRAVSWRPSASVEVRPRPPCSPCATSVYPSSGPLGPLWCSSVRPVARSGPPGGWLRSQLRRAPPAPQAIIHPTPSAGLFVAAFRPQRGGDRQTAQGGNVPATCVHLQRPGVVDPGRPTWQIACAGLAPGDGGDRPWVSNGGGKRSPTISAGRHGFRKGAHTRRSTW
jgi:hypothetical protein